MKTITLAVTATIAAFAAIQPATAQNAVASTNTAVVKISTEATAPVAAKATEEYNKANINIAINTKAVKHFTSNYAAKNVTWVKAKEGFIANFTDNGYHNLVSYDTKGRWDHTIIYYDEKGLPRDVRADVKRVYFDFDIFCAEEIHIEDQVIYLVHIQDEKTIKIIRVINDEIDEYKSLNKN